MIRICLPSCKLVGAGVVIAAAVAAHSVTLVGYGLDSLVETGASTVVIWQLKAAAERNRERRALRIIAASFVVLAFYVLAQSTRSLVLRLRPEPSRIGIAWLAITFVVMVALAKGKGPSWHEAGECRSHRGGARHHDRRGPRRVGVRRHRVERYSRLVVG